MNNKIINIRVPENEFDALARYAAQTRRTKTEVVREFLRSGQTKNLSAQSVCEAGVCSRRVCAVQAAVIEEARPATNGVAPPWDASGAFEPLMRRRPARLARRFARGPGSGSQGTGNASTGAQGACPEQFTRLDWRCGNRRRRTAPRQRELRRQEAGSAGPHRGWASCWAPYEHSRKMHRHRELDGPEVPTGCGDGVQQVYVPRRGALADREAWLRQDAGVGKNAQQSEY